MQDKSTNLRTSPSRPSPTYTPVVAPRGLAPSSVPADENAPRGRDLLVIALLAIGLRAALVGATALYTGWSLTTIANLHDGPSYLRVAANMLDPLALVTHLDRRVFLGYPALIAVAGLASVPLPIAALAISWLGSAVIAVTSAQLFGDRRIGWALVFFPPSFLIYSSLTMSEASMLAFVGVGLYCVMRREWYVVGAIAFGCAGLVRPVACFAVLGVLVMLVNRWRLERSEVQRIRKSQPHFPSKLSADELRGALAVALISAAVVAAGYVGLHAWRGDAFEGVKIYAKSEDTFGGDVFSWPFESLIMTPLTTAVPLWKVGYVWSYVLFVIAGCVIAARRLWLLRRSETYDVVLVSGVWLLANTVFVLCTGSVWGFHYFDRHILAAVPPLLWTFSDVYPRRWPLWLALGILFSVQGFFGLLASAT